MNHKGHGPDNTTSVSDSTRGAERLRHCQSSVQTFLFLVTALPDPKILICFFFFFAGISMMNRFAFFLP